MYRVDSIVDSIYNIEYVQLSCDNVAVLVHSCTNIRSGTSGGSHCVPTVPTPTTSHQHHWAAPAWGNHH